MQLVKEIYANMVDITDKKPEVKVHGVKLLYSKAMINMVFGIGNFEDIYQNLLANSDEQKYNVYMESLCNLDTKWIEAGGEKIVRRINLRYESKFWY